MSAAVRDTGDLLEDVLFTGGVVHAAGIPDATAMHVARGAVTWVGDDRVGRALNPAAVEVDLAGSLVTPSFVDSHVHLVPLGVAAAGIDLSGLDGARELLDAVSRAARTASGPVLGYGWDETTWNERALPTAEEIDRAALGHPVHLARVDLHSALVSSDRILDPSGSPVVSFDLHPGAAASYAALIAPHLSHYARLGLATLARYGVTEAHDMGGGPSGGLRQALAALEESGPDHPDRPLIRGFFGISAAAPGAEAVLEAYAPYRAQGRFLGLGGDLCIDGSIGSRTAALSSPYTDAAADWPHPLGTLLMDADEAAEHIARAVELGIGTSFHAIGDLAVTTALDAHAAARARCGAAHARVVHRIEHAEMISASGIERARDLGIALSMQPDFMGTWGGESGLYQQRLGPARTARMNPLGAVAAAGVQLAFGSDAPVLPPDPWRWIRAATTHPVAEQRLSARAAFAAATRAPRRLTGEMHPGSLVPGAPADFVVWEPWDLVVQGGTRSSFSTDARAGTPLLPDLAAGGAPAALLVVRNGHVIHREGDHVG